MANQRWNVEKYSSAFSFVPSYGEDLFSLITHKGGELLDIGCGSGALSYKLAGRGFSVTGIDDEEAFVLSAAKTYPNVKFIRANAVNFSLENKFSVAFSNAVLHWIDFSDQKSALQNIYNCLKKGGEFVFEMGGKGNCALIHGAVKKQCALCGYKYKNPFYYPSIGEYSSLLESVGFKTEYAVLFDRFTPLSGSHGVRDWINMFLNNALSSVPEREDIALSAEESLKDKLFVENKWYADYVRLRIRAVKE